MPDGSFEPPVDGFVAAGFEAVRSAFRDNLLERGEVGAALTVIRHGEVIVDLWGGWCGTGR